MLPKCPPSCMDICLQLLLLGPKISKWPIPFMREGFSARALLHLFQGPASRAVGAPLPLALCWVPPEGHRGQRWQVSAVHVKDHIMHVFRSFPFYLATLSGIETFASLDLQTTLPQLTGLRSQQTPSHSPLTQEFLILPCFLLHANLTPPHIHSPKPTQLFPLPPVVRQ